MPEYIKVYNKSLNKTYDGILSGSTYFFEDKIANKIAKDINTDQVTMSFDKKKDAYIYENHKGCVEYQGKNIKIGVFWHHAYPIGNDWNLWTRV